MAKKYLDYNGLQYFWQKIKSIIPNFTSDLTNDSGFVTTDDDIEWVDVDISNNGGEKEWRLLQVVTLEEEVQQIDVDLYALGCDEYRIEIDTPAPGESSGSILYVMGWMHDDTHSGPIYSASVNHSFWDYYPGTNNERMCIDLTKNPVTNDYCALRVQVAEEKNVLRGKPITSYKDSGWIKNPYNETANSEKDESGHTPFRGWKLLRYTRKCVPGTQYFVWGR